MIAFAILFAGVVIMFGLVAVSNAIRSHGRK